MKKVYLIGAGLGSADLLTQGSARLIKTCDLVIASPRLKSALGEDFPNIVALEYHKTIGYLNDNSANFECAAVLLSGDVSFYSAGSKFLSELSNRYEVELISGISSLQYLSAKLGLDYSEIKTLSQHGRSSNSLIGLVSYNEYVFILTDKSEGAPQNIAKKLLEYSLSEVVIYAASNLSCGNEKIVRLSPRELSEIEFDELAVLLIHNPRYQTPEPYLSDGDFLRAEKTPMTKCEIRNIVVSKLAPKKTDIIFDIGAGSGSVSIALARSASRGLVFAFEEDIEASNLIDKNINKLKTYNIKNILGRAEHEILKTEIKPDKAFIGGSSGALSEIINMLYIKNENIKIVLTSITLETLSEAAAIFKKRGVDTETICVNISEARKMGGYNMMVAKNPIYIISTI